MEIGYMNRQDQIMIQETKIVNQNYLISWLASVYHQDILICIKSSWLLYDDFVEILKNNDDSSYYGEEVFWQKVTKKTSLQVLTRPPVDVILLPVTENAVLIPTDEKECAKIQKTIKGIIKYTKDRKASFLSGDANEIISFSNEFMPVSKDEIVAEYVVGSLRYPVTAKMLGKEINVCIPKSFTCEPYIIQDLNNKYNLKKIEEQS